MAQSGRADARIAQTDHPPGRFTRGLDEWLQVADRPSNAFEHFHVIDVTDSDAPTEAVKAHLHDLLREIPASGAVATLA
jgi:hypothetical protein